jgi:hypothetical protein
MGICFEQITRVVTKCISLVAQNLFKHIKLTILILIQTIKRILNEVGLNEDGYEKTDKKGKDKDKKKKKEKEESEDREKKDKKEK